MKIDGWADILSSVKTPISLLALISLIVGSLLHSQSGPKIIWLSFLLLFLVTTTCVIYIAKTKTLFPSEIKSIWSKSDLPLPKQESEAWIGKYNCRWTYRTKNNEMKAYVDDVIEIESVDPATGELVGTGLSSYTEGNKYFLRGRVSNKRIAHVFYTSSSEEAGLSGMVILSRPPVGGVTGWWLGAGRDGGDIRGAVTMEKRENDSSNFEIRSYEVS